MFCIWDREYDKIVTMLSNNNFAPKITVVENSVFARLGRGNWESCSTGALDALEWCQEPWELVSASDLVSISNIVAKEIKSKSVKTYPGDSTSDGHTLDCRSASDLSSIPSGSFDLV